MAGTAVREVHRLPPPAIRTGYRAQLRRSLLSGAVLVLSRGSNVSTLDLVREAAGVAPAGAWRPGAGGALLQDVLKGGRRAVLRTAPTGAAGDPAPAAAALQVLAGRRHVPALLGAGQTSGAAWSVEQRLEGSRPRTVGEELAVEVARWAARLPSAGERPRLADVVAPLADRLPRSADRLLARAERAEALLVGLPAGAQHGDLWEGNLLVGAGGALSGVVDWDAWSGSAVPGTDVLHLLGTRDRLRTRRSLGEVLLDDRWARSTLGAPWRAYWDVLDVVPSAQQTEGVRDAWWMTQLAADVRRSPWLRDDSSWVTRNVTNVLDRRS